MTNKFIKQDDIVDKVQKEKEFRSKHTWWVEKYRPVTLEYYIGSDSFKSKIQKYIDNNDFPHLLFHGQAGGGKTTCSKLLANNMNADVLYMNASMDNSIDDVRNKIINFVSVVGFNPLKIVILDEVDNFSIQAQKALRGVMEDYSMHSRFILTCNYIQQLADPVVSRCQVHNLVPPSKKDIAIHVAKILKLENIKFDPKDIKFLVDSYYPDIRETLNAAQRYSLNGQEMIIDEVEIIDADYKLKILEIFKENKLSKKDMFQEIRQIVTDSNSANFNDVFKLLYDSIDTYAKGNTLVECITILAEMEYKSAFVVDKEINFMSTIAQLLDVIKGE